MSETLLAIFLVNSSAKGSDLVYRWPPLPEARPRLSRPRPKDDVEGTHTDNPWRAANMTEDSSGPLIPHTEPNSEDEDDYLWRRPSRRRDRSMSFSHSRSHPASRRPSPAKDPNDVFAMEHANEQALIEEYGEVLGFSSEFLASLLCPQQGMCHQKFELVVDDLAFIGHPVCVDSDGKWRFPEKTKSMHRGRGSKKGESPKVMGDSLTPEKASRNKHHNIDEGWLQTFHIAFVIDLPDPSSYDSGNIAQYFDVLYEQIAFPLTAVLYQEQVSHNFVEIECEKISALENDFPSGDKKFGDFMLEVTQKSTLALAMKNLYEAIKDNTIARITVHNLSFELQLPPHLDELLHYDDDAEMSHSDYGDADDSESGDIPSWGPEMGFKWHLPALAPWKALLRLDDGEQSFETYLNVQNDRLTSEDRELAEKLVNFLQSTSIHLCLADMASVLDWDLDTIYRTVRWLIQHRRAKLIDTVHPGLKTLFAIVPRLPAPLARLSEEFDKVFVEKGVPPLPKLLSLISSNSSGQRANHFYATVVQSKELIPLYRDVLLWLLKHDLLVSLHLYVRIFVPVTMKLALNTERMGEWMRERKRGYYAFVEETTQENDGPADSSPIDNWLSMSPKTARKQTSELSRSFAAHHPHDQGSRTEKSTEKDVEDRFDVEEEEQPSMRQAMFQEFDRIQGDLRPSFIAEPSRATALENAWLADMSEGKDQRIVKLFQKINRYFNGKCPDDEILYRADITRKDLREVLHHYEAYVQTYLHPVCN